jgi:hypothetical protein
MALILIKSQAKDWPIISLVSRRMSMRIAMTGLIYFAVVFGAGVVLSTFREMVLTPVYGRDTAVIIEAPFMLVAIVAGAWIAIHRSSWAWSRSALLMVGIMGFLMVQAADFGVGLGLRGMSAQDQLSYLKTTAGLVYLGLLIVFAAMPLVVGMLSSFQPNKARQEWRPE